MRFSSIAHNVPQVYLVRDLEAQMTNLAQNPALNKPVVIGSFVRFYDCQTANAEKDYSGANPKHYPIGKVIAVYDYKSYFGYTDRVCDIQVGERISKAHFVTGVDVVS
jgi:hypothetical protein